MPILICRVLPFKVSGIPIILQWLNAETVRSCVQRREDWRRTKRGKNIGNAGDHMWVSVNGLQVGTQLFHSLGIRPYYFILFYLTFGGEDQEFEADQSIVVAINYSSWGLFVSCRIGDCLFRPIFWLYSTITNIIPISIKTRRWCLGSFSPRSRTISHVSMGWRWNCRNIGHSWIPEYCVCVLEWKGVSVCG